LLQSGVVTETGPTLDDIHAEEARQDAELKAKKAAALAEAGDEGTDEEAPVEGDLLAAAEAMESISEKEKVAKEPAPEEPVAEEPAAEEPVAEEPAPAEDSSETEASLMKLKKDELVEKAKAAGVATSGTKADIVARLLE
jgi:hypothetical protein